MAGDLDGVAVCQRLARQRKARIIPNVAHNFWKNKDLEYYDGPWDEQEVEWGMIDIPKCCDCMTRLVSRSPEFNVSFGAIPLAIRNNNSSPLARLTRILSSHRNKNNEVSPAGPDLSRHNFIVRSHILHDGSLSESNENRCLSDSFKGSICHLCHKALRSASGMTGGTLNFSITDLAGQNHTFCNGRCECGLNDEDALFAKAVREGRVKLENSDNWHGDKQKHIEDEWFAAAEVEDLVTLENARIGARVRRSAQWRLCDGEDDGGEGCSGTILGITFPNGSTIGMDANYVCHETDWTECCVVKWDATGRIDGYPIGDSGQYVLRLIGEQSGKVEDEGSADSEGFIL